MGGVVTGGVVTAPIKLPNVSSEMVKLVMSYCEYRAVNPLPEPEPVKPAPVEDDEEMDMKLDMKKLEARMENWKPKPVVIDPWDRAFVDRVLGNTSDHKVDNITRSHTRTLEELAEAANYLDVKPLVIAVLKRYGEIANGMTLERIRELFDLPNDMTADDVKHGKEQFAWCIPKGKEVVSE